MQEIINAYLIRIPKTFWIMEKLKYQVTEV